jgi:hypothetical protein
MSNTCSVCGNESDQAFRVVTHDGASRIFDSFECSVEALAPRCAHCNCRILGHALRRGGATFCCEHCARHAASASVDAASEDSFPASDPPAPPPSAIAADARRRRQEGRIGWILLWLVGIPIPVLLVLFALRGCT